MNQQTQVSEAATNPEQVGSVENEIMGDTPNQIQIDQDFAAKVNEAVGNKEEAPAGDKPANTKEVAAPESNNDAYEPAKEFTEFLNKEVAQPQQKQVPPNENKGEQAPTIQNDLSVLQQLLADNPHMAPAVKEGLAKQGVNLDAPGDPATLQRIDGLESTIKDLVKLIGNSQNAHQNQQEFESLNEVYEDVNKNVPDYGRTLADFFSNALLRDYDLQNIDRGLLEESNKAVTSELDNYYQARLKAEGYTKANGVPPSMNSRLSDIAPPPGNKEAPTNTLNSRMSEMEKADADLLGKVTNLFTQ